MLTYTLVKLSYPNIYFISFTNQFFANGFLLLYVADEVCLYGLEVSICHQLSLCFYPFLSLYPFFFNLFTTIRLIFSVFSRFFSWHEVSLFNFNPSIFLSFSLHYYIETFCLFFFSLLLLYLPLFLQKFSGRKTGFLLISLSFFLHSFPSLSI